MAVASPKSSPTPLDKSDSHSEHPHASDTNTPTRSPSPMTWQSYSPDSTRPTSQVHSSITVLPEAKTRPETRGRGRGSGPRRNINAKSPLVSTVSGRNHGHLTSEQTGQNKPSQKEMDVLFKVSYSYCDGNYSHSPLCRIILFSCNPLQDLLVELIICQQRGHSWL